jgi:hypothetical protein
LQHANKHVSGADPTAPDVILHMNARPSAEAEVAEAQTVVRLARDAKAVAEAAAKVATGCPLGEARQRVGVLVPGVGASGVGSSASRLHFPALLMRSGSERSG